MGSAVVLEITIMPRTEWAICKVMNSGTPRARRKVGSLACILSSPNLKSKVGRSLEKETQEERERER